ncbi:HK97-gp10 family putative phage morphogenesis protein [Fuscibacter oryzae]|uniref:HK97 gp10 family phage protein n=1 Tax=Fuscibacter oryzae TaxID=2803939 RepID=A0A8J7MRA7_9RHOB|nr:HK97-gp10 family putative phage morphogenesis protein [Fuscibacter oryzae]MBL4928788.1 HK97 gp10 family phage protein [Fuscibacter oryzae]
MADDGGLAKFQRRMQAIPEAAREAVKPALLKAADITAGVQRSLAPVDSGDMAASIAVTGPGQSTPAYSQPGGSMIVPENAAAITVGNTDVRYAHLVEHGTEDTPAQAFFWPGFRLTRKRAAGVIKRAIGKAIREAR